jgi:hypothetical protein
MTDFTVAINALENEAKADICNKLKEVWNSKPDFSVGNFSIENSDYRIRFKHKEQEDVDFELYKEWTSKNKDFPFEPVSRISWSSWSFSNVEKEELEKAIDYLQAAHEMVSIVKEGYYMEVADEYWTWVKENVLPLTEKLNTIDSAIHNLRQQQKLEVTNSDKQKAVQFFKQNEGKEFIFHERFYYNNKDNTNRITIRTFKKDKVQISFYGTNKWYDEDKMLDLYKHIMKRIKISHVDYSKDWEDETRTSYQEFDNVSNSDLDKINLKDITKEEYRNR